MLHCYLPFRHLLELPPAGSPGSKAHVWSLHAVRLRPSAVPFTVTLVSIPTATAAWQAEAYYFSIFNKWDWKTRKSQLRTLPSWNMLIRDVSHNELWHHSGSRLGQNSATLRTVCWDLGCWLSYFVLWNIFWKKLIWCSIRWFLFQKSTALIVKQNKHKLFKLHENLQMIPLSKDKEASGGALSRTGLAGAGTQTQSHLCALDTNWSPQCKFRAKTIRACPASRKTAPSLSGYEQTSPLSLGPKCPSDDTGKCPLYPAAYITGAGSPSAEKTQMAPCPQCIGRYKERESENER